MQVQDISKLLNLQDVKITGIDCTDGNTIIINIQPDCKIQSCPCCQNSYVVLNGKDGFRKVEHLPIADKKCILVLPKIRLLCKKCFATFGWCYEFITGKQRYTQQYKTQIFKIAIGSTVENAAQVVETPYSTVERFFKEMVIKLAPLTEEYALKQAQKSTKLVLGIDDFAIRKGHNYNTGIHDLRGESFLAIIKGRKITELMDFIELHPEIAQLSPYAVVMDLAKNYHTFVKTVFPNAIRIADRFHVNGYIIEALDKLRKRICNELNTHAKLYLYQNKSLLLKRNEKLNNHEKIILKVLLSYSKELRQTYLFKEKLAQWYDCSPSYELAKIHFDKWLKEGHSLNIPEVNVALKTFENWRDEILNYHRCPFTNGIVEGRNGKIKGLQRRRFFLQNRTYYEALIILECNKDLMWELFNSNIT